MKSKIIAAFILCLALSACVKEKMETIYSKQETQIDTYLSQARVVTRDSIQLVITPNKDNPEVNDTTKKTVQWKDTLNIQYNKGAASLVRAG